MRKKKLVIAITGASGSIYAKVLFKKIESIKNQIDKIGVIMSDNAKDVWKYELDDESYQDISYPIFDKNDFMAPFASGSAQYETMIIIPCSMGTLGRIASGISNDLTTRAADVMLKERRKLILVARDTPLNLIHLNNMKTITEAGGIICPAVPSFYSKPKTIEDLAETVVNRVLDLAGFELEGYRWGEEDTN
ncbi:MAG: UbiX family flavin prenyltransferase [Sphingobacteriales bacterium]|nr:UbiX family flavin prenyltransferase [Sphingobacteriales bacterium]